MIHLMYDSVKAETENALLIEFEPEVEVWLPKSQVDCDFLGVVVVPEWLAVEKEIECYEQ